MRKNNIVYLILAFLIFTITFYFYSYEYSYERTNLVGKVTEVVEPEPVLELSDYPDIFIEDNKFNGVIVVGADATANDVMAAADIVKSLESIPISTEIITGDAWKVGTSTRKLEMSENRDIAGTAKENIANITSFLDSSDLNILTEGEVTTDKGTAKYAQYLYFENKIKSATSGSEYVIYLESDEDIIADFFFIKTGEQIARYLLEFKTAFKSAVEDRSGNSNTLGEYLYNYEGRTLNILGNDYEVIKARRPSPLTKPNGIDLTLMNGVIQGTLEEGATKTYTIDEKEYTVKVAAITDTNPITVKFDVNGETTPSLREGSVYKLLDKTLIGVTKIMPNEAGDVSLDMVEFYLGASSLFLEDTDISDTQSSWNLIVSNDLIKDAKVTITGSNDNITFAIDSISINITADDSYYVPAGGKLSSQMDRPQALLNFDIFYEGLTNELTEKIKIKTSGSDQYVLELPGYQGPIPIAYTQSGTNLQFGDDDDSLILREGQVISRNDYFIITDESEEPGERPTYALRYKGANKQTTNLSVIKFDNLEDGTRIEKKHIRDNVTGKRKAILSLDNSEFVVYNASSSLLDDFNISVDLNADGAIGNNIVKITTKFGAEIELIDKTDKGNINIIIRTVNENDYESLKPSDIKFDISAYNGKVRLNEINDLKFLRQDQINWYAYTSYSTFIKYTTPPNDPQELTIDYPLSQRTPNVYITSGAIKKYTKHIEVGPVKTDSEIQDIIAAQNIITVGNSCHNKVTAKLMGTSTDSPYCLKDLFEGYGLIKLYKQTTGKFSLVVAGYNDMDTRRAAKVLANYKDFELEGMEECVAGTSLDLADIRLEDCPGKVCEDSDSGIDYYEKGECKRCITRGCAGTRDFCVNSKELKECYCKDGEIKTIGYECPNGCKDGACVKEEQTCTTPTDGMVITEDTIFCGGTYNLPNGITIGADNIELDCNDAILFGDTKGRDYGIYSGQRNNIIIKNCDISDYEYGIFVKNASKITLENNEIRNTKDAFLLISVDNSRITENTAKNNGESGFFIESSKNNIFIKNEGSDNMYSGFYLSNSQHNDITENIAVNNWVNGFRLHTSSNFNVLKDNIAKNNKNSGFYSYYSNDNVYKGNIVVDNYDMGFENWRSNDNTFEDNTVSNNGYNLPNINSASFFIAESSNNMFINNLANHSNHGFFISQSDHNIISRNIVTNNNWNGIFLTSSNSTFIKNNNIFSNDNYNLYNDQPQNITAEYNYWGTTDREEIVAKIYDYYDDNTKGLVDFEPWLNELYVPPENQFTVSLDKGWNLISIPLILEDNNIENVFNDIKYKVDSVYSYEPTELNEWKIWHPDPAAPSDLIAIEPGKGYWVKMKEKADLEVLGSVGVGEPPLIPTFEVTVGWNLIGLYSLEEMPLSDALANIENKYSSVWTYQGGALKKLVISRNPPLIPGEGYWLYMKEKGSVVP